MAHQTDKIPWNLLGDNLQVSFRPYGQEDAPSNLQWKPESQQAKDDFVAKFCDYLEHAVQMERQKYPENYEPLLEEQIVLSDAQIQRAGPLLQRVLTEVDAGTKTDWAIDFNCVHHGSKANSPSTTTVTTDCSCNIPWDNLTMKSMRCELKEHGCFDFNEVNGSSFLSMEIIKVLIMQGEMDTILAMSADEGIEYSEWRHAYVCQCTLSEFGWYQLYTHALQNYLWLNVLYCLPDIWEPKPELSEPHLSTHDSRNLLVYQQMVRDCTISGDTSITAMYPFQDFFNISEYQFNTGYDMSAEAKGREERGLDPSKFPMGIMSYSDFLKFENPASMIGNVLPSSATLTCIRQVLQSKGLPGELVQHVMELTGYIGQGSGVASNSPNRLQPMILHHPFHPENKHALLNHLNFCWRLLVHCDMFSRATERYELHWDTEANEYVECQNILPWDDMVKNMIENIQTSDS